MVVPNGSPVRQQADYEEVKWMEESWNDLRRMEELVRWLDRRVAVDPACAPEFIREALDGQQATCREFLRWGSWEVIQDSTHDAIDRQGPLRVQGAELRSALEQTEAAIGWFDRWFRRGSSRRTPDLVRAIFDEYTDIWVNLVALLSNEPLDG